MVRIIYAEDNVSINKICMELFSMYYGNHFVVESVYNGRDLVDSLRDEHKLVITDNGMPIMCGLDAVREIRNRGYQVPIIMLSADLLIENDALGAGVTRFVLKGGSFRDLSSVINEILGID